jgi:hypothetical protein
MESPASKGETLPEDLIYDIIIDLVAEYLHLSLLSADPGAWNALVVLPRISRLFYSLVQPLFRKIFGEESEESVE